MTLEKRCYKQLLIQKLAAKINKQNIKCRHIIDADTDADNVGIILLQRVEFGEKSWWNRIADVNYIEADFK